MFNMRLAARVLLALSIFTPSFGVIADDYIQVRDIQTRVVEGQVLVDCEVRYRVPEKIRNALENGVMVYFLVEIELRARVDYWLDDDLAKVERRFGVRYHALSDQFLVSDSMTGGDQTFPDLFSAFAAQARLSNIPLVPLETIDGDTDYYLSVRAGLDPTQLPLPLRMQTYFSTDWRPSSGWSEWPL